MKAEQPHNADPSTNSVRKLLSETARQIDSLLPTYLPDPSGPAATVIKAMHHSLPGGKRLRPLVVMQAAETFGLSAQAVIPTACAFELLHTATLIHDDLPTIDDSPLRRGRPSCHVAFDEATAVLAGDALIIAAYGALARQALVEDTVSKAVLRVISEFADYTGAAGLIGGEAADIYGEQIEPDAELLRYIHLNKTAKLFIAAARAGAILAQATEEQIRLISNYAEKLGLLFQVTDDILDVSGEQQALGKPVGADQAAAKQTYPALLSISETRRYADELAQEANQLVRQLPNNQQFWQDLIDLVLVRRS